MAATPIKPRVRISPASFDGAVRGRTVAHAKIEMVNLSRIACQRLGIEDTRLAAVADAEGFFAVRTVSCGGDLVRLRARHPGGTVSRWVTIRIPSKGRPRRPDVALFRIGFRRLNAAEYGLLNINRLRPISEPGAVLLLKNLRTSVLASIELNEQGTFHRYSRLVAEPGDRLSVWIGRSRRSPVGALDVPRSCGRAQSRRRLSRLVTGYADALFEIRPFRGAALTGQPRIQDVIQGELTDCHLAAAAGAVVHSCWRRIPEMIHRLDRDSYKSRAPICSRRRSNIDVPSL